MKYVTSDPRSVGGASAATSLSIQGEGEIGVAG